MRTTRRRRRTSLRTLPLGLAGAAAALALAFAPAPVVHAPAALEPAQSASREWSQSAGGGTWASSVQGIVQKPTEAWRIELDAVHAAPVTWKGHVYFVGEAARGGRKLFVVSIGDGAVVAEEKLGRGERAWLVVSDDGIGVADEKGIQTYTLEEDDGELELDKGKKIRGDLAAPPTLHDGLVFWTDGERAVFCADFVTGKELGEAPGGYGRPCVVPGEEGKLRVHTLGFETPPRSTQVNLTFKTAELDRSGRRATFEDVESRTVSTFKSGPRPEDLAGGSSVRWDAGSRKGFYVYTPFPVLSSQDEEFHTVVLEDGSERGSLHPIATPFAYDGRNLYGFARDGSLQRVANGGSAQQMMSAAGIPSVVQPGPITVADRVLYLGAAAVEAAGGSVLWQLDDADTSFPIVPIADGRATYVTTSGSLVCLADPTITPIEAMPPPVAIAGPAPRPDQDGAVLADGTFLAGDVAVDGDVVKIASSDGDDREVSKSEVAMVLDGASVEVFGDEFEFPIFAAWNRSLLKTYADTLAPVFERFAQAGMMGDCKTILQEAERLGYAERWTRQLTARIEAMEGAVDPSKVASKRASITDEWVAARERTASAFVEAAKWCRENELPLAATCLLAQSYTIESSQAVLDVARELMDPGFPYAQQKNAPALWLRWSYELLPAGGRFVSRDDPLWTEVADTVWADGSRALRTKNVTLLCKDPDPAVIGACLRSAEAAVRALEELLPPHEDASAERLDVRVHRNREEYLDERSPTGEIYALPWSAGFYSPSDRVSRFYVTRDEQTNQHVDRPLEQVLVHELTHHYVDMRFTPGHDARASQAGYWIVEGFASFVADQVVEMGGEQGGYDDPNVKSVDATAACARQGVMFAIADFVDMPQARFAGLGDDVKATVYLRSAGRNAALTERGIFYEQAAALVYFLMNECGDEVREQVVRYLRDYDRNRVPREGWERLGFESAAELQEQFVAFLDARLDDEAE